VLPTHRRRLRQAIRAPVRPEPRRTDQGHQARAAVGLDHGSGQVRIRRDEHDALRDIVGARDSPHRQDLLGLREVRRAGVGGQDRPPRVSTRPGDTALTPDRRELDGQRLHECLDRTADPGEQSFHVRAGGAVNRVRAEFGPDRTDRLDPFGGTPGHADRRAPLAQLAGCRQADP
jgi:hypothetical protein